MAAKRSPRKTATQKGAAPKPKTPNTTLTIAQVVEKRVSEVQALRERERATRAKALKRLTKSKVRIRTELVKDLSVPARGKGPVVQAFDLQAAGSQAGLVETAGYLLAVGDSWFAYPVHNVLTKLQHQYAWNIESTAICGAAIEHMISPQVGQLEDLARRMDKIVALGTQPKAVLVSGGGNDIAGTEFGMLINDQDLPGIAGWNNEILDAVINMRIKTAYLVLVGAIQKLCTDRLGHTVPIFIHGYDYPVPDGRGFLGGWGPLPGPWLKPGFDEKEFSQLAATTQMMLKPIDLFNQMLMGLAPANQTDITYINVRRTLSNGANYKQWWANELHPTGGRPFSAQDGFLAVAEKFQAELEKLP